MDPASDPSSKATARHVDDANASHSALGRFVRRFVDLRPGEGPLLAWATLYFFLLLACNFMLRPVREALGLSGGIDRLPLVWSGTLIVALCVQPLFAALVARWSRARFIPFVYRTASVCLIGFWILFELLPQQYVLWPSYGFYIWLSVFNLFAVSIFWGFMADIFRLDQAKRVFGLLSVGGTLGAIAGAQAVGVLVPRIGSLQMFLIAPVLLELAVFCVRRLVRRHEAAGGEPHEPPRKEATERVSLWHGLQLVSKSSYLQAICAFTFFHALVNTVLYFQQGGIVDRVIASRDERTVLYAQVEVWTQSLTLFLQLFVTASIVRVFGMTFALASQPFIAGVSCIVLAVCLWRGDGWVADGWWTFAWPPELVGVVVAIVLTKACNNATAKPAREALYTVVARDVKYKSKSFIDTFVYRGGDALGAWTFALVKFAGVPLAGIAAAAVPLTVAWFAVGRLLGRQQRALAERRPARVVDATEVDARDAR